MSTDSCYAKVTLGVRGRRKDSELQSQANLRLKDSPSHKLLCDLGQVS